MNRLTLLPIATLLLALPGAAATDLAPADPAEDVEIICSDDPAGWTVCFAYNAIMVQCRAFSLVDAAQCVANHELDNAQAYTDRMCTHVFQPWVCDQPPVMSPYNPFPVDCVSEPPLGRTFCYVIAVPFIAAFGCPGMTMDSEWAQCVTNKEIDTAQGYYAGQCADIFQPWVCSLVRV